MGAGNWLTARLSRYQKPPCTQYGTCGAQECKPLSASYLEVFVAFHVENEDTTALGTGGHDIERGGRLLVLDADE